MPQPDDLNADYAVVARASRPGPLPFVLKQDQTFAVFDGSGDLRPELSAEVGVFSEGTRHLSRMELRLWGERPLLLSSSVREDNCLLVSHLTNPDIPPSAEGAAVEKGSIYIARSTVLDRRAVIQRFRLVSYAGRDIRIPIQVRLDADFRDVFEVRGTVRPRRGTVRLKREADRLAFHYRGLNGRDWWSIGAAGPPPAQVTDGGLETVVSLPARGTAVFALAVAFDPSAEPSDPLRMFDEVTARAIGRYRAMRSAAAIITTSNPSFNQWLDRSLADIHMLCTETDEGPYPFAGIPWYSCPFGRDGLLTARQCLLIEPLLARGVLSFLARTQATEADPARDAEPGKILHEARLGEMADLGEIPFGRYYGTVDATPLFVMLAGDYLERTGDIAFLQPHWPAIRAAMEWVERGLEQGVCGFLGYRRQTTLGLINQGWKDSHDSIFHADGADPPHPVALCEVQAYAFAALRAAAAIADRLGQPDLVRRWRERAAALQDRFEEHFWCDALGTYAAAIDGAGRPCAVPMSNAGHALFGEIASPTRAASVAARLMAPASFSGWGIRTLEQNAPRYNPMSYHNGSVWPHDNSVIGLGFSRYGFKRETVRLLGAIFDASAYMPMHRLPELFCGFERLEDEGPTMYPVACMPQAWASAAVFALLEAATGIRVICRPGERPVIHIDRPMLPEFLDELRIDNLRVGADSVDLTLHRYAHDVGTSVRRGAAGVEVLVRK